MDKATSPLLPIKNTTNPSTPQPKSRKPTASILWPISLLFISMAAAIAGSFGFFRTSLSPSPDHFTSTSVLKQAFISRPQPPKLKKPVVILISSHGFRFGYQFKTPTPNIDRLIASGTEADRGLIPVFPTMTFPNHYSIATGLYPAYHGIVNENFVDPISGERFSNGIINPKWWLGEPIWATAAKDGLKVATLYWPGTEVNKGNWTCPPDFCHQFNISNLAPFEQRVDTILGYFDLPSDEIPSLMMLCLQDPDDQGRKCGPDDPRISDGVAQVDSTIGRLIVGLEDRKIFDKVHIILVGDHGMVATCDSKLIFLEDLAPWINISAKWIETYSPLLTIRPPSNVSSEDVVEKIKEGLKSGKIENSEYLQVYLKEELPDRLVYNDSDRITPIVGLVAEGFKLEQRRTGKQACEGANGYDNAYFSMRSIFVGHGPRFKRGCKFPSFENVQIYNLVASILKIPSGSNNGTDSFPKAIFSCHPN